MTDRVVSGLRVAVGRALHAIHIHCQIARLSAPRSLKLLVRKTLRRHGAENIQPRKQLIEALGAASLSRAETAAEMAEEYQLSLTLPQVQALIRALEQCGVDSGSPRIELEHFRSAQVVTAAKSAYEVLKAKKRRIERIK
jgi:hypothetical protein